MRKLLAFFVMAVAIVTFSSCGGSNATKADTPTDVAVAALEKAKGGNYEAMVDMLVDKNGQEIDQNSRDQFKAMVKEKTKNKPAVSSYEIVSEEISADGNKAVVKCNIVYADGSSNNDKIQTVKGEDGKWHMSLGK